MQKVAVVTGAARGLGSEIALALGRAGFSVVVHYYKSKVEAEHVLANVQKASPDSISISADLVIEKQVDAMFASTYRKYGRVDVLVNNVGNFLYKKFGETTNLEFRDVYESNVYSTLFCSRAAINIMRRQKSGHILNIGAVGAERFILRENSVPYFMAKNAVYVLTKTMAWEEAGNGIRVNMVSPGSMKTDIFAKADFPMKRETKASDVTRAVLFLISDEASYINGGNLEVAGGFIPGMK